MTGKAAGLRKMIEKCLDDNPDERPPMREVSTIIKPLTIGIIVIPYIAS